MITVRLMGGLGNQMFQYAAARRLSHFSDVQLKLDLSWFNTSSERATPRVYSLHQFNILESAAVSAEGDQFSPRSKNLALIASRLLPFTHAYFRDKHYHFEPSVLKPRKKAYLDGYWQSERYFEDIREIIAAEFTVKTTAEGLNKSLAEDMQNEDISSIALHVRRGDYVAHHAYVTCSLQYYASAVSIIASQVRNPHFFIFSDEPAWVSSNFAIDHPFTAISHNGPEAAHEDLRLMSICKHHIIANSTFSWWGAWLSKNPDKLVFAPKLWFANPAINTKDIVPSRWMRV